MVTLVKGSLLNNYSATPFPGLLHFTLDLHLITLSVKQASIKYHFLSLWYDSTWDWTSVSQTIGEHSTQSANVNLPLSNVFKWSIWTVAIILQFWFWRIILPSLFSCLLFLYEYQNNLTCMYTSYLSLVSIIP